MAAKLKPVAEQVIVITGASSGIGLATAQAAAKRGARVVLNSRDAIDLATATDQITADGGEAIFVVGDVSDPTAMQAVADTAMSTYGRIDTWVNNAGVSVYGELREVPLADARKLFETNYWGTVTGSLTAIPHLESNGGALINVGSELSDTAYPLQGHYAASKHAVKGFTDTLRMELEKREAPISVTLIQPAAIDTPYPEHAQNYMDTEPKHQAPVYAPEIVADAILTCAQTAHRNVLVGGAAKMFVLVEKVMPGLGDKMKVATAFNAQRSDKPVRDTSTLHAPRPGDGRVRGDYPGHVAKTSLYTKAALHPIAALAGVAVVSVGVVMALLASRAD